MVTYLFVQFLNLMWYSKMLCHIHLVTVATKTWDHVYNLTVCFKYEQS